MKICRACEKNLQISDFYQYRNGTYRHDCKSCFNAATIERRQADPRCKQATNRDYDRRHPHRKSIKAALCQRARLRGRAAGMAATIRTGDLDWPDLCPVLGIPLDYDTPRGRRKSWANSPSLDRWDNTQGYVLGNVYVISMRANALKRDGNADELIQVALYAKYGVGGREMAEFL